ncbi:MAG TPA: EamA family transporter, partial [Rubrivivax sp.]|nr:EamA family transporter [Rubrivivax sp.]HPO19541.1 EamA family transporter [Rubrivivax sp.]
MSTAVVLAVLLGALLHAGWNALVKSSGDKQLDLALLLLFCTLLGLPLLALSGAPPPAAWPYIGASMLIHMAYHVTLNGAYQHGELGATYPVMRGSAPLLVALGSAALLGESPSPRAWLGIGAVTLGVLLVGLSRPAVRLNHGRALAYALANALVIAAYTLVDGQGVRITAAGGHSPIGYVLLLMALNGLTYPSLVIARRGAAARRAMRSHARRRWPLALGGAAASMASYGIALWAMTRAPVAAVSALRETSVLFAAVLSVWVLHERFGVQRALGAAVIVAGVAALRLRACEDMGKPRRRTRGW